MATRIAAASILGPLVLLFFYLGSPFAELLVVTVVGVATWEWVRLCRGGEIGVAGWIAIGLAPAATVVGRLGEYWHLAALAAVGALAVILATGRERRGLLLVLAGPVYLGAAGLAVLWIRSVPGDGLPDGLMLLLWLVFSVWATDIFAYFVGRSLGGPKLAPRISPNKTWSGLAGGVVAASSVGLVFAHLLGSSRAWAVPAVLGAALALTAQAGDLVESGLKRRFGVKDSSALIPGHGGVLDRIDGLVPASIAVAVLIWLGEAPF